MAPEPGLAWGCRTGAALRVARDADAAPVVDCLGAAFAEFGTEFIASALLLSTADVRSQRGQWLVVAEADVVLAAVRHRPEDNFFTFSFLAVRPELRRQGFGAALVTEVERRAATTAAGDLRIVLRRSLIANIRFFTRLGYRYREPFPTGTHDVYAKVLRDRLE